MQRIILPVPVSANRYWRYFRGNIIVSREACEYRELVILAAKEQGIKLLEYRVGVDIKYFPHGRKTESSAKLRRLDLDNVAKVILDSLCGVAFYDDYQVVDYCSHLMTPIYPRGHVTVTLRDLDESE